MDGLIKTTEKKEVEEEFSFKKLFVPLTTIKAIHWIIFIGIIVYANMLFNGFVSDDSSQIVNNTTIHSLANFPLFFSGGTFYTGGAGIFAGSFYKPLMLIYFSLLYTIFGPASFPFHL